MERDGQTRGRREAVQESTEWINLGDTGITGKSVRLFHFGFILVSNKRRRFRCWEATRLHKVKVRTLLSQRNWPNCDPFASSFLVKVGIINTGTTVAVHFIKVTKKYTLRKWSDEQLQVSLVVCGFLGLRMMVRYNEDLIWKGSRSKSNKTWQSS